MIKKIKKKINIISSLSIISFLKANKRNIGSGFFIPFLKSKINLHKTSIIDIKQGQFKFNNKWDNNEPFSSMFSMRKNSKFIVKDSFEIHSNSRLTINENATLELGSGYINNNFNLACFNHIKIGNNVAISENVVIRDSDNHSIISSPGHKISEPIQIGDNVWIGMNVIILKGVKIGDGSIIGAGTVLTKSIPSNSLAVGVPGKVIKKDVNWSL